MATEGDKGTWLSKKEWDELDHLLGKHGFGGYYDLVESLKIVLRRISENKNIDLPNIKDLPSVVKALLACTKKG